VPPITDHYGIAVGIDTYPSLRKLTSAVGDATRFCEWLLDENGGNVHQDNVKLIPSPPATAADRFDAKPIQDDIERALRDFGAEVGKRIGKRLYFYFAGHGFGPSFDEVGMLMANASMNALQKNIGLREFRDYFHERGLFDEVVFILDCCRDSARGKATNGPGFDDFSPVPDRVAHVVDFVVLGAAYGEKAFAPIDQANGERRGILTRAILEALRGDLRALDPKGRVTAATLKGFIRDRVPTLADDDKLKQAPEVPQDADLVLHQVDLNTIKRAQVHVIASAALATGDLVLLDGTDNTELDRISVDKAREANPWQIQILPITRYIVEHSDSDNNRLIDPAKIKAEPHVVRL
jgi:uncharacterized caspase-like protein